VKAGARDNALVGKVEVFQVAPVLGMTIRTVRLHPRTIREAASRQCGDVPEFAPGFNSNRVRPGWAPAVGCILDKIVGRKDLPSLDG
jgi:hypothetical protein